MESNSSPATLTTLPAPSRSASAIIERLIGQEYADVRFDDWVFSRDPLDRRKQEAVLGWLRNRTGYRRPGDTPTLANLSRNIVFQGPVGTGKDRLAAWLLKVAVVEGKSVLWFSGPTLHAKARDYMTVDGGEEEFVAHLLAADILILSDPAPPGGSLTAYQAAFLYRVVDERGRRLRPTWVTVNVGSEDEAERRLTPQVWDRLIKDADHLICDWHSFRRPRNVVGVIADGT